MITVWYVCICTSRYIHTLSSSTLQFGCDTWSCTITCPPIKNCYILCEEQWACGAVTVNASAASNLYIECTAEQSCSWANFDITDANEIGDSLNIAINGKAPYALHGTTIHVSSDNSSNGSFALFCSGSGSCDDTDVRATNDLSR